MLIYSLVDASAVAESDVEYLRDRISSHFSKRVNLQRRESVLGKALLAHMLKEMYGVDNFFADCSENGKPFIVNSPLHFNISHCDDYILCVCANRAVGCDVEKVRPYNEKVACRFFTSDEFNVLSGSKNRDADFMRMWTLKESALKFSGEGLSGGLNRWDFSEYYTRDSFCIKDFNFTCRTYGDYIVSICSTDSEIKEFKTDIIKITDLKGE